MSDVVERIFGDQNSESVANGPSAGSAVNPPSQPVPPSAPQQPPAHQIDQSVQELNEVVTRLANFNLAESIPSGKSGELAGVFDGLSLMTQNIAVSLRDVSQNTVDLKKSGQELLEIAETVMKSCETTDGKAANVAGSTSEMSNNMNAIAAAAEELSVNMKDVSLASATTSERITNVATATEEMTATISEIASNMESARGACSDAVETVSETRERVRLLGAAAEEITQVTGTIADISDRTKYLALNATIESARAGEAGKGFAVVASEVKALALQTEAATVEIRQRIEAMLSSVRNTVDEIGGISNKINNVNDLVCGIASAVEEQSVTSNDIADNVHSAVGDITDVARAVDEATIAVADVTRNITEAADLGQSVARDIQDVSEQTESLRRLSAKCYATSSEIGSMGTDIERLLADYTLPTNLRAKDTGERVPLIRYGKAYDVGIDIVNDQHIGIMERINKMHWAVKDSADTMTIVAILEDLTQYTVRHFSDEEDIFTISEYPKIDTHLKIHKDILAQLHDLIAKGKAGEELNFISILAFLKDWLQTHIAKVDFGYAPYCGGRDRK